MREDSSDSSDSSADRVRCEVLVQPAHAAGSEARRLQRLRGCRPLAPAFSVFIQFESWKTDLSFGPKTKLKMTNDDPPHVYPYPKL